MVVGFSESTGGDAGDSSILVSDSGAGATAAAPPAPAAALEAATKRLPRKQRYASLRM